MIGLVAHDHQMAQHGVVEAEARLQLVQHVLAALDVQHHVVRLGQVLDRVSQLAAAPVFQAVNLAAVGLDQRLVALDHRRHLFALVRVDQKHDFIMTHDDSLWISRQEIPPQ